MSLVLKVVIPVKTGIHRGMARHDFWIPTYVGMTKRLKNGTYDTKPPLWEREKFAWRGRKGEGVCPPPLRRRRGGYRGRGRLKLIYHKTKNEHKNE
jgi:hypothetical protein